MSFITRALWEFSLEKSFISIEKSRKMHQGSRWRQRQVEWITVLLFIPCYHPTFEFPKWNSQALWITLQKNKEKLISCCCKVVNSIALKCWQKIKNAALGSLMRVTGRIFKISKWFQRSKLKLDFLSTRKQKNMYLLIIISLLKKFFS